MLTVQTFLVSTDVWSINQLKGEKKYDKIRQKKKRMKDLKYGRNQKEIVNEMGMQEGWNMLAAQLQFLNI